MSADKFTPPVRFVPRLDIDRIENQLVEKILEIAIKYDKPEEQVLNALNYTMQATRNITDKVLQEVYSQLNRGLK